MCHATNEASLAGLKSWGIADRGVSEAGETGPMVPVADARVAVWSSTWELN